MSSALDGLLVIWKKQAWPEEMDKFQGSMQDPQPGSAILLGFSGALGLEVRFHARTTGS